ncbi:hypothetical protein A3H38_00045 [candidate division WOR-1 bacterium RIFCSPLOWO2_02_FULL_46_20]|uniref:4Fe-4S ferredoxin-type domain-containing protein n=2 Tax=Saganbacteria TaxID=1703751 RepID=A0A1F4RA50_UNCSA|nr:MAG: hypothetical protein A3J44_02130 [candidate division WOR-1 bacterium RIFCSPHIGHO2_02_FULL_45_12]OGC04413.1 MAG: hypothetical protein A3H38_00045 [candidate division WOR-1 bacterium RIFCSPLOWO2_02_FULL_46_20]OGC08740.1 MAG: hypothetical protein A3F86_05180 [candidate division WOR-1 bacterium RIFCSPLOWO2_12_FULL_45_9]
MSKVAITKCDSYDQNEVDRAVQQSLELIGGLANIVKPGNKVLLKVNALMGSSPEAAVTTHPSLVTAVIKEVKKCGGIALVGDSPGNASANVRKTMVDTGFKKAADEAGGEVVYFQEAEIFDLLSPSHNKKIKTLRIASKVLDADVIINLPKLKTHNYTLFTGAIKNMFGAVPGFEKAHFHIRAPRPHEFAESLVDILELTKPHLNIMDAVMGMEGHGPTGGSPRKLGIIMASTDPVAMDAVGGHLIGYEPSQIDTTVIANRRGLGESCLDKITIFGTSMEEIKVSDWKLSTDVNRLTRWIPGFMYDLVRPLARQARIDPYIIQDKCTKCLVCVKGCPAKTINYDKERKIVEIDLKDCINCFCCHELCEYKAIKLKRSWLARKLGIGVPGEDE